MTPEQRVEAADKALNNYLEYCKGPNGITIPSTEKFSDSVQQALMDIFPDDKEKVCPMFKHPCIQGACAWWSNRWERCGMVSPQRVEENVRCGPG